MIVMLMAEEARGLCVGMVEQTLCESCSVQFVGGSLLQFSFGGEFPVFSEYLFFCESFVFGHCAIIVTSSIKLL